MLRNNLFFNYGEGFGWLSSEILGKSQKQNFVMFIQSMQFHWFIICNDQTTLPSGTYSEPFWIW